MAQESKFYGIKLETPANYRIRAQGHLDDSWSDRLDGAESSSSSLIQKLLYLGTKS